MGKKQLTPAPIDNKNICTDFADVFHGGEYVEQVIDGRHEQLFFLMGSLFSCFIGLEKIFFTSSVCVPWMVQLL